MSGGLATLVVLLVLGGSAAPASSDRVPRPARTASYDLSAAYPNAGRARGYFLQGVSEYASPTSTVPGPHAASLWFQPSAGGAFRQFNTAPYRRCHWDLLRWGPGPRGVLVYLATHAECYADHTAIVFRPGIVYMPKSWVPGQKWGVRGVSGVVYYENGIAVCAGTNTWRSRVVGVEATADGKPAVHTQTNETQTLSPIRRGAEFRRVSRRADDDVRLAGELLHRCRHHGPPGGRLCRGLRPGADPQHGG